MQLRSTARSEASSCVDPPHGSAQEQNTTAAAVVIAAGEALAATCAAARVEDGSVRCAELCCAMSTSVCVLFVQCSRRRRRRSSR
jgi:hypothetical protein